MSTSYTDYLDLLESLAGALAQLTDVAKKKTQAVRADDLTTLNECLKQEQALSLALRGYEQKQRAALSALSLSEVPLASLPAVFPQEIHLQAKAIVENLQRQYQMYRSAADTAMSTLECNLHQIEKIIAASQPDAGYDYPNAQNTTPDLPSAMRTDIRA